MCLMRCSNDVLTNWINFVNQGQCSWWSILNLFLEIAHLRPYLKTPLRHIWATKKPLLFLQNIFMLLRLFCFRWLSFSMFSSFCFHFSSSQVSFILPYSLILFFLIVDSQGNPKKYWLGKDMFKFLFVGGLNIILHLSKILPSIVVVKWFLHYSLFNVDLKISLHPLIMCIFHIFRLQPCQVHPSVIRTLMGCLVINDIHGLDLKLWKVFFLLLLKKTEKEKTYFISPFRITYFIVLNLPNYNEG